jgi:hypothetical protein
MDEEFFCLDGSAHNNFLWWSTGTDVDNTQMSIDAEFVYYIKYFFGFPRNALLCRIEFLLLAATVSGSEVVPKDRSDPLLECY